MRECVDCKSYFPLDNFPKAGGGYYRHKCKPCYNTYQAKQREKNPEAIRKSWRKAHGKYYSSDKRRNKTLRAYGLDEQAYNDMFDDQGGACKICRQELPLVVDHCHNTGKIRGLLCNQCNIALGAMYDDVNRLREAIVYLQDDAE